MLAKCITSTCDSQFKYFGRGVLMTKRTKGAQPSPDAELFWMCDECARKSAAPPEFVAVSSPIHREKIRTKAVAA